MVNWRLIFLLALISKVLACDNKCLCIDNYKEIEYQCPKNTINRVVIHVKQPSDIQIDCYNLKSLNTSILPNLKTESVENFFMQRCPLPKRGFAEVFQKLGLNQTEYFIFDYHGTESFTVDKKYFKGFNFLKGFTWDSYNLLFLREDLLENMPNLIFVDLKNNKVNFTAEFFKSTPSLMLLDISQNNLTFLPIDVFRNLHNLSTLHLERNNLEKIQERTFGSLFSLTTLELSYNKISVINGKAFVNLTNLRQIDLSANKLRHIPKDLFKNNKHLEEVRLSKNSELKLPYFMFANMEKLKTVLLDNTKLEIIPERIFENSTNLELIDLSDNLLKTLPEKLFYGLGNISKLLLDNNLLTDLPNEVFSSLENLETLSLERNLLTVINGNLFKNLQTLGKINLSYNRIKKIDTEAFVNNPNLLEINLAFNEFSFEENELGLTPFTHCKDLEYLDLSYNFIDKITNDLTTFKSGLKFLDLSHNLISSLQIAKFQPSGRVTTQILLSFNKIKKVDFNLVEFIDGNKKKIIFHLDNNPLGCDCHSLDLVKFFQEKAESVINNLISLKPDNLMCVSPPEMKNRIIQEISPKVLKCSLTDLSENYTECPSKCDCFLKPYYEAVIVNCSDKNLTTVPDVFLSNLTGFNHTEVYLDGNYLVDGPGKHSVGYNNVTKLFLSRNQIRNLTWLPPKIQTLTLDHNNITTINSDILDHLSTAKLTNLSLGSNPLICDCSTLNLTNFIRKNVQRIDINDVKCSNSDQLLVNLSESTLCQTYVHIYVITVLTILLIVTSLSVLYYIYQLQIKVWLYSRNLCLWWVTEEELDKNKIYDAFISYSHKDEDFITENLLPMLEGGPQPYKLCLHYRNWIPGEFIAKQVVNSVKDSRRTIVVLSPNFLDSVWSKLEFRTAHTEAMSEGRARVIVILYGDIDMKKLDKELKSYLDTNTYVKWGDPWFWNKLKFALPHSRKLQEVTTQIMMNDLTNTPLCYNL